MKTEKKNEHIEWAQALFRHSDVEKDLPPELRELLDKLDEKLGTKRVTKN